MGGLYGLGPIIAQVAIAHTGVDSLQGNELMQELEKKQITFSSGEVSREKVVDDWLNNPHSGYIKLGQALLKLLQDKPVLAPSNGQVSLTAIKGTLDQILSQHPEMKYEDAVKKAFIYRWNEKNGGSRDQSFADITSTSALMNRFARMSGEELATQLEQRNILLTDGNPPRATIVAYLNDKFSGYQEVARKLLVVLDSNPPLAIPSGGKIPLTTVKASVDAGMSIENALINRWNEKNGTLAEVIDTRVPAVQSKPDNYLGLSFDHWKESFTEKIGEHLVAYDPLKPKSAPERHPSEGMGYGMIFSAWMEDGNTFNMLTSSLYTYYVSDNGANQGLPAWGIDATGQALDTNSASDADLDIAIALIKRYKQTGNESLKQKALALLAKIKEREVIEQNGLLILKPGSSFGLNQADGSVTVNPSYIAVGYFDVFAEIDVANAAFWKQLKSDSYKVLLAVYNQYSGFPDWVRVKVGSDNSITIKEDYVHGVEGLKERYDGIRTYWRIAVDAIWNKDGRAKRLLAKALRGKNPENIQFDGSTNSVIGVFMYAAGAVGSGDARLAGLFRQKTDQSIFCRGNRCFYEISDPMDELRYYNQSVALLAKLLIDGQFTRP